MKAVGYARVSTIGQAQEGISLLAQEERIKAWCIANDFTLETVYIETMGAGRADNRPKLQNALRFACQKKAALVVYSLSRLARSTRDTILISERLDKAGADLVSLSERIDTTSAVGKMVFRVLSAINEFERDQLSERTIMAMAHLRNQNKRISARIPLGYDLCSDGVSLIENEKEQELITKIETLRGEGRSLANIAQTLQTEGIKTKSGGKSFYPSTIKAILDRKMKVA